MNLFVTDFLSDPDGQPKFDVLGGLDGRSQKVYALLRRRGEYQDGRLANDPITVALFDDWLSDVDGDAHLEPYDYTRDPLVIDGELQGTGDTLRILSLHTKSKYVDRQEALWIRQSPTGVCRRSAHKSSSHQLRGDAHADVSR